jgi:hypothetical protein
MVIHDAADGVETAKNGERTAARTRFEHTNYSLMSVSHGIENESSTEQAHGW